MANLRIELPRPITWGGAGCVSASRTIIECEGGGREGPLKMQTDGGGGQSNARDFGIWDLGRLGTCDGLCEHLGNIRTARTSDV